MRPRTLTACVTICVLLASLALVAGGCGRTSMKLGEWAWGDVLRVRVVAIERASEVDFLDDYTQWVEGDVLRVRVASIERWPEIGFLDGDTHVALRAEEGNELVMVWLELHNQGADKVSLSLDSEAVELIGAGGVGRFRPLDPFGHAVAVEQPLAGEERYTGHFLWGGEPVEIEEDYYLSGWAVFEVPEGTEFKELNWRASETVSIEFRHLIVRPKDQGNELALVQMDVVNHGAARVFLSIDADSMELSDEEAIRQFDPVDPFVEGVEVEEPSEDEGKYVPLLWKPIELDKDYQISGWVIFEVPKGMQFKRLVWRETDSVYIYFF